MGSSSLGLGQLVQVFNGVAQSLLAPQLDALNAGAVAAQINTSDRWCMWLAQLGVECEQLQVFEENLNYSAAALLATWPLHFNLGLAAQYARQPQRIANHVYALRHGNGDEPSGDGWRYRGRGAIGLTFFDNYSACGTYLGLDLRGTPELAAGDARFQVAAWFWMTNGCNQFADAGDVAGCTRRINGGLTGLTERLALFARAKVALTALEGAPLEHDLSEQQAAG